MQTYISQGGKNESVRYIYFGDDDFIWPVLPPRELQARMPFDVRPLPSHREPHYWEVVHENCFAVSHYLEVNPYKSGFGDTATERRTLLYMMLQSPTMVHSVVGMSAKKALDTLFGYLAIDSVSIEDEKFLGHNDIAILKHLLENCTQKEQFGENSNARLVCAKNFLYSHPGKSWLARDILPALQREMRKTQCLEYVRRARKRRQMFCEHCISHADKSVRALN